ncbi:MAG TPA: DUF222 domain-containing protein [Streptosporangiaceae bacterium]
MDWEWAALPHEEDLSLAYPQEVEPGADEEWLDEISYVLAGPGAATSDPNAVPDPGAATSDPNAVPDPSAGTPDPRATTPGRVTTPKPEDFAAGGAADALAPGPALATLVDLMQRDGLGKLDDDQLTGVLQAANRLAAWSASVRVSAVSGLAARREATGRDTGDWRPFDHADDEIAVALTLTRRSAARLLDFALGLDRLPLTRAALAAGQIDERRAEVIAEEVSGLDDAHAAAVEKLIIGRAPKLTSGQLRALVRRAVLAADPRAARRRKDKALQDARVEAFPEHSGTAALAGRDLPPAAVLAADKHLTALAQAMKAAGIGGTLDILRARAYLHLLSGQPASTLIATHQGAPAGPAPGTPAPAPRPPASAPGPPASAPGTPAPAPGNAAPAPGNLPAAPGSPAGGGLAAAGLRGSVNLTMPLSAWLGWTQSPGDIPGYGPLDAGDCSTLAHQLAANPASRWCVTLTDPHGHPVAHACARHGPGERASPREPSGPGERSSPATPSPPTPTTPAAEPGPATPGTPATPATPGSPVPDWLRGLTFATLATSGCTHERQSRSYRPSPSLRHLICIRNPVCTGPGCRHAATRCDLDHVTPYHRGGKTCECNLHPACRHDHHTKQAPGWTLTSPAPGTLTWTTPGNRTHTTTPAEYWE